MAGKKIWAGGPALKPNVRLTLQRSSDNGATWEDVPNNEVFLDATHTEPEYARRAAVTLNGGTTPTTDVKWYTTKNSPGGVEYIFSIRENALTNYTGLNVDAGNNPVPHSMQIMNVYQSPLGLVTLTKVWAGGPAIRPAATVTIQRSTDGVRFRAWHRMRELRSRLCSAPKVCLRRHQGLRRPDGMRRHRKVLRL